MASTPLKKTQLFQFLYPGVGSIGVMTIVAFFLLALGNSRMIFNLLVRDITPDIPARAIADPYTTYVDAMLALPIIGRVTLLLFWGALGSLLYVVFWFGQNVVYTVGKEVKESEYISGRLERHGGYWGSVMSDNVLLLSSLILGLFYLLVTVQVVYPYVLDVSAKALHQITATSWVNVLIALAILTTAIYIGSLVLKTLHYAWQQFNNR